ncbi:hypothetical protein QYS49_06350 [Marivirga salinae]|uniref:Methyltransferase n=1 Tax=Marivirga salinarum TaxID=3059078 RepID=A0AA49JBW1_9BACT|nr:hypothetical protein [Marivirga sp. BDSF4-3]WKK76875.1 hypothetical protein QYS49_06350 [Marivirga sp. BDSF4-3]
MINYESFKKWHNSFTKKKSRPWWYWKTVQIFMNKGIKLKGDTLSLENDQLLKIYNQNILTSELKNQIQVSTDNLWTLDAETLNFLWAECNINKPKIILEFGSGISTKLFYQYFAEYPQNQFLLISIDQDQFYLTKTLNALRSDLTNVTHHPMNFPTGNNGFMLNHELIENIIKKYGEIDFVLIDAPYGAWEARLNTLPSILNYCKKNALWFLDDAFRDSEMEILRKWKGNNEIKIEGIVNIGKGIAKGFVK